MSGSNENLTPMMRQYREAKRSIPADAVLLFRLGDFYEEFFEDAEKVSRILELVLTHRQGVPMCGFPYHALDSYLPRLIAAGIKVGIAEQMEDPKLAKGIVTRQVTRIVTPGTVMEQSVLAEENNFLAAAAPDHGEEWAVAALDVSTGEFFFSVAAAKENVADELQRLRVKECLIANRKAGEMKELFRQNVPELLVTCLEDYEFDFEHCSDSLKEHFKVATLDSCGCREHPGAVAAAGAVLNYAVGNLRRDAGHVTELSFRPSDNALTLDAASCRHLELLQNRYDGGKAGSLLGVLDHTQTAMGGRRLRSWLLKPLFNHDEIIARLDGVTAFFEDQITLAELREVLGEVRDLERITARMNVGSATPRDFLALSGSIAVLPDIKLLLQCFDYPILLQASAKLGDFHELKELIDKAISDHPPLALSDGGVIREGYNATLDDLRRAATDGKSWLAKIQQREVEATGIKSLKVKYNNVFGYYIEVSKSNLSAIPQDRYIRKQTLVNAERFITPELKELESKILGAEEKARALEAKLFAEVRESALVYTSALQHAADAVADLDVLAGLAEAARLNGYVRPEIYDDDRLIINAGRHPVIEQALSPGQFVPNDCRLDGDLNRLMLLTGPNMAGKSTYIRQTALIVIMAQIGSFVPATHAEIGLVDRIFTRIGAADDLQRGQSTFMVEMVECANILRHASGRSLVILDEIGRGTSTFDGLSIAWSVAEFLHDEPRCRTQFATHYHEMTELAETRRGVKNYNVAVREYGDNIIFLRQIIPGTSDRSYGIHVARLAGLPEPVLERAKVILNTLEENAAAPKEALSQLPREIVRRKHSKRDEADEMLQLRLL